MIVTKIVNGVAVRLDTAGAPTGCARCTSPGAVVVEYVAELSGGLALVCKSCRVALIEGNQLVQEGEERPCAGPGRDPRWGCYRLVYGAGDQCDDCRRAAVREGRAS